MNSACYMLEKIVNYYYSNALSLFCSAIMVAIRKGQHFNIYPSMVPAVLFPAIQLLS
jgi:hypothetical protein